MKIIRYPAKANWGPILSRPFLDPSLLEKKVRKILKKVKNEGDRAVRKFTKEFDGVKNKQLIVSPEEMEAAKAALSPELLEAIRTAKKNIEKFHAAQLTSSEIIETMPGIRCWRTSVPIEKVGLYIPGGTAPLFSTVLMLGIPAKMAGCGEIVLCSPPQQDGRIHAATLVAAAEVGVTTVVSAGGVQAIAALAYGTESIPKVFKIFGPGNQYVNSAKQLVQADGVAIDMPAGPSEVCVLADDSANPAFIAADLLSQAEHGPDSQVLLITTSEELLELVEKEIARQLPQLSRKALASQALESSSLCLVRSVDEAIEMINEYAPEHLIIACRHDEAIAMRVINAGSVFLGNYSPESAGDYASGTNHALPTNGYARNHSGVSVDSFVKKITYQKLSGEGIRNIGNTIITMAEAEGLEAHARAVTIRLNQLNKQT
jgi:histidinol dehydrogenase